MNNNTNLFGQSTPVNQNRIGNNYLFGSTTLVSPTTSLSSRNSFEKKEKKILFGNNQPSTSTSSNFTLGNSSSFFPTIAKTNTPFTFSLSKSTRTSSTTTTIPVLFSTMNQSKSSPVDLQLYQTMINTQPFNNQLDFLAKNIKPNVNLDRARFTTTSNRPINNIFSSVVIKSSISNKRKYDEYDDETLLSTNQISKINIKRPRMLDMNKIRSIILGNNETSTENLILRLPRLTRHDYYTKPTIEELQSCFNDQGQCFVKQFTIGRKHYGSVIFKGLSMNLAGLDLDRLVEIDHRQVTVYPNDKDRPNEGEGLNCQAIISLIGVYPIDRSIVNSGEEVTDPDRLIEMNYGKYLEKMTQKFQGQFLDYDIYTGTWTFQVEHF